jgi:hypothetical protein
MTALAPHEIELGDIIVCAPRPGRRWGTFRGLVLEIKPWRIGKVSGTQFFVLRLGLHNLRDNLSFYNHERVEVIKGSDP